MKKCLNCNASMEDVPRMQKYCSRRCLRAYTKANPYLVQKYNKNKDRKPAIISTPITNNIINDIISTSKFFDWKEYQNNIII